MFKYSVDSIQTAYFTSKVLILKMNLPEPRGYHVGNDDIHRVMAPVSRHTSYTIRRAYLYESTQHSSLCRDSPYRVIILIAENKNVVIAVWLLLEFLYYCVFVHRVLRGPCNAFQNLQYLYKFIISLKCSRGERLFCLIPRYNILLCWVAQETLVKIKDTVIQTRLKTMHVVHCSVLSSMQTEHSQSTLTTHI